MTKVKICGLSTPEAVQTAVEAGADYIGFVFAPSKRQVTLEQARQLATGIPKGVQKVGVFVSPQREEVEQACQVVGLDLIQVHGPMDDAILQEFPPTNDSRCSSGGKMQFFLRPVPIICSLMLL